jgi:hypothetical protein
LSINYLLETKSIIKIRNRSQVELLIFSLSGPLIFCEPF